MHSRLTEATIELGPLLLWFVGIAAVIIILL